MKKTVTTILSLALALIMVSSLSSGVILAKGDDDHDNRKKNKNKYETVREVAILDCVSSPVTAGATLMFSSFDGPVDVAMLLPMMFGGPCAEKVAVVLNEGFKLEGVDTAIFSGGPGGASLSRHTFMRSKRMLIVP